MSKELVEKISNLGLRAWQEGIIYNALLYQFINNDELDRAVEIVKKYNSEDELFYECSESKDKLSQSLANASQI